MTHTPLKEATPPTKKLRSRLMRGTRFVLAGLILATLGVGFLAWMLPAPALFGTKPQSLMVLDRQGILLRLETARDGIFRLETPLEEVSPFMVEATLNYEDQYFYQHIGVNPWALIKGAVASLLHRPIGASTITMQVARMAGHLDTRSVPGKLWQIWMALRLEAHYSKAQILEAYFNLAPYGGNIEGIETASLLYFQKHAKDLTPLEALKLSVIPQNPRRRHPWVGDDFVRAVRLRLLDPRFPLPDPVKRFEAQHLRSLTPTSLPFLAPHFVEHVKSQTVIGQPNQAHPPTPLTGRIVSTLDMPLQAKLENTFQDKLQALMRQDIGNGGFMVVDGTSGEILSYLGSRDFFDARFPGQVDGLKGWRNPGSTLKPFIYGIAAEKGMHSHTVLWDLPLQYPGWRPQNADGTFLGPINAWQALVLSRNPPAITLYQEEGPVLLNRLEALGIPLFEDKSLYGLSVALGGVSLRPIDVAYLYTTFTHEGVPTPLVATLNAKTAIPEVSPSNVHPQHEIEQGNSTLIAPSPLVDGQGLLAPGAAELVRAMMEKANVSIPLADAPPLPLAYKTGTSQGRQDAWTVGTVGPFVLLVWLGDPTPTSHDALTGFDAARPVWLALAKTLANEKNPIMKKHPRAWRHLRTRDVCSDTGDVTPDFEGHALCAHPDQAYYVPGLTRFVDSGLRKWGVLTPEGTLGCETQNTWTSVAVFPEALAKLTLSATGMNINRSVQAGCLEPLLQNTLTTGQLAAVSHDTQDTKTASPSDDMDTSLPLFMVRPPKSEEPQKLDNPLRITSPTPGTKLALTHGQNVVMVRLEAVSPVPGDLIWFEGSRLLGQVAHAKPLDVPLSEGSHTLSVMDKDGHKQSVTIMISSPTPFKGLKMH